MTWAIAHLTVAIPFVVAAIVLIARGWSAEGDGAVITARSFDLLTTHAPLVGQITRLRAPAVFDLGPLEYWLLTIPVHLDPRDGALWGSALMCVVAVSLAVEGCFAAFGLVGAVAAAAVTLGDLYWMPHVGESPLWNPYFGEMWFLAAVGCALAVLRGRMGFLPLLILSASVAMQAHLMFAVGGALLSLVGIGAALVAWRRSARAARWLLAAAAVGIACWAAPLVQQFTARSGNLGLLISSSHTEYRIVLGLEAVTRATVPPMLWLNTSSPYSMNLGPTFSTAPAWPALLVLTASVLFIPLAVRIGSRSLLALAIVNVILLVNLALYFGGVPPSAQPALRYLITPFLVTGTVAWVTLVVATIVTVTHVRGRAAAISSGTAAVSRSQRVGWTTLAALVMAASVVLALVRQANTYSSLGFPNMKLVAATCQAIERKVRTGPVQVGIKISTINTFIWAADMQGVAACLRTSGYAPELPRFLAVMMGPQYSERAGVPIAVLVRSKGDSVTIEVLHLR